MSSLSDKIPRSVLTTIRIGSSKGRVGKSIIDCNLVVVATSDTLNIVQEAIFLTITIYGKIFAKYGYAKYHYGP